MLVMFLQLGFRSCVSNREQALKTDGVEGSIRIPPVREKWRKSKDHRAASFLGEASIYCSCAEKLCHTAHFALLLDATCGRVGRSRELRVKVQRH
jgi:hypothetical protein